MPLTQQMNVLRVFLASPSDLEDERKATKEMVDRLNLTIRAAGWTVELLGWEDRLPGFGRPQAQINAAVDACDLFLGVLWRRWGSPSGKFKSGFEEEFERAISRRKRSESPEIWIYFKRVEDTSDPGEQLQQVLAFRKKLEQRRELLFKEFDDTSEWATVCHDALLSYVLKRVFPGVIPEVQSTASTTAPSRPGGAMQTRLSDTEQGLPEQLSRVFVAIGDAAKEPGSAQFNAQLVALGDVDLVRLHLLGASLMYEGVSQDILSNHAANLVYRHRNALGTLTGVERRLALSSLLREGNQNVPGWYWVRDMSDERVSQWLEDVAMVHPDEDVRMSTLNLLSSRPDLPGMTRTNELVDAALCQPSDEMRTAALTYADRFGDSGTADIIVSRIRDIPETFKREAIVAIGRILARQDPNLALDRLLKTSSEPDGGLLTLIRESSDQPDDARLHRILVHKSSALRVMAAERLAGKDLLTAEEAKALLGDSEVRVRAIGIRRLIALGERPTAGNIRELLADDSKAQTRTFLAMSLGAQNTISSHDLVEELFSTLSYDELIPLVSWFSQDGRIAYKVLGLMHFDRFGDKVRTDMADRFATFHEAEKHAMKQTMLREGHGKIIDKQIQPEGAALDVASTAIEAVAEKMFEEWADNLDNFITSGFVSAGLAALAKNGSVNDLPIARQHLDSKDSASRKAALEMVAKFGNDADVEPLLALAAREYGDIAERAAKTALALSADRWIRAKQYVEREAMPFLRVGIDALGEHTEFPSRWLELVPYLFVGNASVRLATAKLLCSRLEDGDLVRLLNQCLEEETYYYDVVAALDRSIYGPTAWRSI